MWMRRLSYLATFTCCREGVPEGNVWNFKRDVEEDFGVVPRGTLYGWGAMAMDGLEDIIEGVLDDECNSLFPGISRLELCFGSVVISGIVLEQFIDGRRSKVDSMIKRRLE